MYFQSVCDKGHQLNVNGNHPNIIYNIVYNLQGAGRDQCIGLRNRLKPSLSELCIRQLMGV